jgi:predicted nucleic acid-binding protein
LRPIVVDASVALKWFFRDRDDEPDAEAALAVLRGVRDGAFALLQPPHFVAEVAAVLAREMPATALHRLRDLLDIEMTVVDDSLVYTRAMSLARQYGHHLFDTLYHAVAIESRAMLITADDRYARKARDDRHVVRLADFAVSRR